MEGRGVEGKGGWKLINPNKSNRSNIGIYDFIMDIDYVETIIGAGQLFFSTAASDLGEARVFV